MGIFLVTPPAIEPLTLDEARSHLRLGTGNAELAPAAPTVALISPAAAGNVDNGAHRYRVTFVTANGETEGGTVSDAVTVVDKAVNGKVTVSAIPVGGSAVTSRKIYRTIAGGSTYLLLATIADNTTTTYTDNTADAGLGAGAPSTNTTEDVDVVALLTAAREWVEKRLARALITQTWRYTIDRFPGCLTIELPRPNLLTVSSITYVDNDGATQTMSTNDYAVDTDHFPGRIILAYGASWPSTREHPNAVTITYTAGYGATRASVPAPIKAAIKLRLSDLYMNREGAFVGTIHTENPALFDLLAPYEFKEAA